MSISQKIFCSTFLKFNQNKNVDYLAGIVNGIPWEIRVEKTNFFNDSANRDIEIYLQCGKKNIPSNLSYLAFATIEIKSNINSVAAVKLHTVPYFFNHISSRSIGIKMSSYIDWNDLVDVENGYVNDNGVILDITITVANPNYSKKSELEFRKVREICRDNCIAEFELLIKNINCLMAVKSPVFIMQNYPLNIVAYKHQGYFDVHLLVNGIKPIDWNMSVKLLSTEGEEKSLFQVNQGQTNQFISWDELLKPDNGFIINNSIRLEVTIVDTTILQCANKLIQTITSMTSNTSISMPRFFIEIPKISELEHIGSPEVFIRGVPWMVSVRNQVKEGKKILFVYLHCSNSSSSIWSYTASSSIKLLPYNDSVDAVECHNVPMVYNNENVGIGYGDPIIEWDDLFKSDKCYVKNDMITLDIKIDVADPNDPNKSALIFKCISDRWQKDHHKYQLTVTNIKYLIAVTAPIKMKNSPGVLSIFKHQNHLGVGLYMYAGEKCTRSMVVKLLSSKGEKKSIEQFQSHNFEPYDETYIKQFILWDELLKPENGFVNNESITLEVVMAATIEDARVCYRPTAPPLDPEPKDEQSKTDCPICFESMKGKHASSIPCGHLFCTSCIENILEYNPICPLCRKRAEMTDLRRTYI